jgi:transposase
MTKTYILKTQTVPAERGAVETYLAPPPPSKGKIIGLDCHPDTFTAAVFVGQTPHDARKIGSRENLSLEALLKWAAAELTPQDIILMEAGGNSFEVCKRLGALGLKACVLESCHVGKHAKTYADNDKMAAARIALVYLAGNAPCVWVPNEQSRERRERRKRLYRLIAAEMAADPKMMRCMKVLGVGIVSAFALLAVIDDIGRFHSPEKLVAYIGLNPGQRQSGKGKDIRLGVGRRGRGDIRHLLIQGAHAIMRSGRNTPLGQWGWKLFARKGNRNVAVAAIARKLLVQVWHMLNGNPPLALESDTSFRVKLQKLAVALGSTLRTGIGLGKTLEDSIKTLLSRCHNHPESSASPCETPQPA